MPTKEFVMRVVHYLNQFFGGLGGEEKAGTGLESRDDAVGPGKLLEQLFGSDCQVVTTLICGDNYAVENQEALTAAVLEKVRTLRRICCRRAMFSGGYGMVGALCAAVEIEYCGHDRHGVENRRRSLVSSSSARDNGAKMRDVDAWRPWHRSWCAMRLSASQRRLSRARTDPRWCRADSRERLCCGAQAVRGEPFEAK
jgi:hypothetical protein